MTTYISRSGWDINSADVRRKRSWSIPKALFVLIVLGAVVVGGAVGIHQLIVSTDALTVKLGGGATSQFTGCSDPQLAAVASVTGESCR